MVGGGDDGYGSYRDDDVGNNTYIQCWKQLLQQWKFAVGEHHQMAFDRRTRVIFFLTK